MLKCGCLIFFFFFFALVTTVMHTIKQLFTYMFAIHIYRETEGEVKVETH